MQWTIALLCGFLCDYNVNAHRVGFEASTNIVMYDDMNVWFACLLLASFSQSCISQVRLWLYVCLPLFICISRWSLTMDEEVNPDHENVNSVLAQDSIELFHILSSQSHSVIMELCQMMPSEAWRQYQLDPSSSSATARPELIKTMLEYFRSASARRCRNFLQRVCFSCENIPMLLESRLMSVAGYDSSEYKVVFVSDQNTAVVSHFHFEVHFTRPGPVFCQNSRTMWKGI